MGRWLRRRRWLTFSLRTLLVAVALAGIWLGYHTNWIRQRHEARRWIELHETAGWSRIDPCRVMVKSGIGRPAKPVVAPWGLRLLGESSLAYIHLDKSKLRKNDVSRIDSLLTLFPESKGVHIEEPGWCYCWPTNAEDSGRDLPGQ